MKQKVLLVEDQENIAKLFSYNLEKAGYECFVASNGREGYDKAKEVIPDIIISDIMMPEVDGYGFRRLVMTDTDLKSIPFVFLTAKGEEDDILEGYNLEIQDYILKTASAKIVIAKISAILKSTAKERTKVVDEVSQAADKLGIKVVPDEMPEFDGFNIKHWHKPYHDIPGGDFIDYLKMDEDNFVVVLGDVMGKKWGAWYFAVAYAGYVRSAIRFALQNTEEITPARILDRVNKSIYEDERLSEVFITLSIIIVNKKKNTATYSGAGDLPVVYKTDVVKIIQSNGLLLGFNETTEYEDKVIEMKKDESLFIFTDGIIESRNADGEMFGHDRLNELIGKITTKSEPLDFIKENFIAFTNDEFEDDLSIITITKA